jgi:hypothetical protein
VYLLKTGLDEVKVNRFLSQIELSRSPGTGVGHRGAKGGYL